MVPKQLVSILNSGRCIAVVGSGPSNEMGYPSWKRLAELAAGKAVERNNSRYPRDFFERLISEKKLPEVFKYAAKVLGGVDRLLPSLRDALKPKAATGKAYDLLARWPLRYYMTTNYDTELTAHRLGRLHKKSTMSDKDATLPEAGPSRPRPKRRY